MSDDPKKHILHLIERYSSARCQEGLAGQRDAMSAVQRHHAAGKKAWDEIGDEIDKIQTELAGLRTRCLCRGTFRCTPCLEEMEADGIGAEVATSGTIVNLTGGWVQVLTMEHASRIDILKLHRPDGKVTCAVCLGAAKEQCGCDGTMTAAEAIRWHESQLEILSK